MCANRPAILVRMKLTSHILSILALVAKRAGEGGKEVALRKHVRISELSS